MLRPETETRMDALAVQCRTAAALYRQAAGLTAGEKGLSRLFSELAARREGLASELERHLRALGDLPSDPDRDRQTLDEILTRLKSAWAGDQRLELIKEGRQAEASLAARVTESLAFEYPEPARAALAAVREDCLAAQQELRAAAAAITPGRGPK